MSFTALGCKVDPLLRSVTDAGGRTTRLEPKACDLLVLLAGRPGEVISVEQLIESVWGGKFVTSDVVTVAVHAVRQAFGDNARSPRFIETVRGRGYCWIAPLDQPEPAGEEPAAAPQPPTTLQRRPSVAVAFLLAFVLLVSTACVWMLLRRPAPLPSMTRTQAVMRAQARGLFYSDRWAPADMGKAIEEFRRAIAGEPRFAEPHAALAEALVRRMEWTNVVTAESEARHEAARAIELDPRSPLGQAARASVEFVLDRDMAAAERSFRRAIELDPTIPSVRRRYGYLLAVNGRFREAVSHTRAAAELAPTSSSTFADLGWVELLAGDTAAAQRDLREALRLDPANGSATMALVKCLDTAGRETEAWSELHRGLAVSGLPQAFLQRSEAAYAAGGLRGVYATWAESGAKRSLPRFVLAVYTAQAGQRDRALALLRQAVERREPMTLWMTVHPAFAALHHDAEFLALARRAGLGATVY